MRSLLSTVLSYSLYVDIDRRLFLAGLSKQLVTLKRYITTDDIRCKVNKQAVTYKDNNKSNNNNNNNKNNTTTTIITTTKHRRKVTPWVFDV